MLAAVSRHAGIVLHPTSLPGPYGIGDIGPQARAWVDFLARAGCDIWQVLPLGPTGYGNSPYQTFSSFAGNEYLVSPQDLTRDRLLPELPSPRLKGGRVDYGRVIPWKLDMLEQAWQSFSRLRSNARLVKEFERFRRREARWLADYALFRAVKEEQGGRSWTEWPAPIRRRDPAAVRAARRTHRATIDRIAFSQFLFFRQWGELKAHAEQRGVRIMGDVPIFTAHDSADVWTNVDLFRIKADGQPSVVAGVPPDYYSKTGQLWGNPLYRWSAHQQSGFNWWVDRVRSTLRLVDIIRLDHFRGFYNYWQIPAGAKTAVQGRWVKAPGRELFTTLQQRLGDAPFIAEDLGGDMPPGVAALRNEFGLPGMVVLQFAFGDGPGHEFLPHNFRSPDWAVYTSTHDNNTSEGYREDMTAKERRFADAYLAGLGDSLAERLIRLAWSSTGRYAMTTAQDVLGLGSDAKMNVPGTTGGNWEWRLTRPLAVKHAQRLRALNATYGRGIGAPRTARPSWT